MATGWRAICSCGRWVGYAYTETEAQDLAAEHRREPPGEHVVEVVEEASSAPRAESDSAPTG